MKTYQILQAAGITGHVIGGLFIAPGAASASPASGPAGVATVTVALFGAQGGSYPGTVPGGLGGAISAALTVSPGEVLQVNVGAKGSANTSPGGIDSAYGPQLKKLNDQYVVMTLGANTLLSYYTNITFPGGVGDVSGPCVNSTGYKVYYGGSNPNIRWFSGPISKTVGCLDQAWTRLDQTQRLVNIYKALLSQHDHVLVLGYYRACSWSFGNWQPAANIASGPPKGHSCSSQSRPTSPTDSTKVTQWEQAVAVGNSVNDQSIRV